MKNNGLLKNILIFGNGPVALHLYLTLKKQHSKKLGLKIRKSLRARKFYKELKTNNFILEGKTSINLNSNVYGKVRVKNIIESYQEIIDEWEVAILATPCDSYMSILKEIDLFLLKKLKIIILISPELGSSYFIKDYLRMIKREDIEIISFSNYFGATNFLENFSTKIIVNALKRKIYLSSTKKLKSKEIKKWIIYLKNLGIEGVVCKTPIIAESKNITIFVHSPFLFNEVSLKQIFFKDLQKKFIYKLYPEGPITKYLIEDMITFYYEVMELYNKIGIEKINLLEFLNENYPVLKETLHDDEIEFFLEKSKLEQEYLLYIRYCSILIDPYSIPDKDGRYFDFSRVEYSKIYLDKDNKWNIPRRPLEDYFKLNLLMYLSKYYKTSNLIIKKFIQVYEKYYYELLLEKGKVNISSKSYIRQREEDAIKLYNFIEKN